MRKSKQSSKSVKKHSLSERAHLRAVKRRSGPSAVRRRSRRHDMFVGPCGCIRAKHGLIPCAEHAVSSGAEEIAPDGEDFRGNEAAGFASEQMAAAQRLK